MTPSQIAILQVMSPSRAMTVREIAIAAFGADGDTTNARQLIYQRLNLSGASICHVNRVRHFMAFQGRVVARSDVWPRQWWLTEAGEAARKATA